ncbi:MAG TPA: flavin reductase family protein [Campylobacterales bacterium]|nr:flavin reductase family protein [Campylobacterales bacterium]HHS93451.1 flavin reductase family protein [Campylobacterales bacterium]
MLINFNEKTPLERYKLISNSVIPRPIAWVMTKNHGILNIAPFSYFTPLSSEPATLLISIGHKTDAEPKDTLKNLRETKKCVISIVGDEHFEKMHLSAATLDANESEIDAFEIETKTILENYPPIPNNIQVAYFCDYLQEVALKDSKTVPTIVEIKHLYIKDTIITDRETISFEVQSIGRIGKNYAKLGTRINP